MYAPLLLWSSARTDRALFRFLLLVMVLNGVAATPSFAQVPLIHYLPEITTESLSTEQYDKFTIAQQMPGVTGIWLINVNKITEIEYNQDFTLLLPELDCNPTLNTLYYNLNTDSTYVYSSEVKEPFEEADSLCIDGLVHLSIKGEGVTGRSTKDHSRYITSGVEWKY